MLKKLLLSAGIALIIAIFFVGLMAYLSYSYIKSYDFDVPYSSYSAEKVSPGNWISEENVKVTKDKIIINVENPRWAKFTDTNSMDPVFDAEANVIEFQPKSPEQLRKGDIISYKKRFGTIIHRIVETGEDNNGWYAITKGDNNVLEDPEKVRFEKIKGVVVAIIY